MGDSDYKLWLLLFHCGKNRVRIPASDWIHPKFVPTTSNGSSTIGPDCTRFPMHPSDIGWALPMPWLQVSEEDDGKAEDFFFTSLASVRRANCVMYKVTRMVATKPSP